MKPVPEDKPSRPTFEDLAGMDSRDIHVPARKLDDMLIEATQTKRAVETLTKTSAPLKAAIMMIVVLTAGATKFYIEWTNDRLVGTPALQSVRQDLERQIIDTKNTGLNRSDQLNTILTNQTQMVALLSQRVDQAEKRLQRLEDKR